MRSEERASYIASPPGAEHDAHWRAWAERMVALLAARHPAEAQDPVPLALWIMACLAKVRTADTDRILQDINDLRAGKPTIGVVQ